MEERRSYVRVSLTLMKGDEGTCKVVCDSLNVRSTPSVNGASVAGYSCGERIYSIAADTVEADGYIWTHYTAYSRATRYVAIGTTDGSEKYLVKV